MNGKAKIAFGTIGVLAAGIAIGLLTAPQKGKKTRRRIKNAAVDCLDRITSFMDNGRQLAEDVEEKSAEVKKTIG